MFRDRFKGKKVFVTGHTGFKGSWLCQWLLLLGAEVAGYSLYVPSAPSNYEVLDLKKRLAADTHADVRDPGALAAAMRDFSPDIVFHLAAQPIVRTSYDAPRETFETNVMGMVNVIEAIRETKSVRAAVLITSDKCYENVEWEYGYKETDHLGGKDPYSASKACAEIVFSGYFRSFFAYDGSVRMATTRAGNVIGGGDWATDRIVPDCIRAWSRGEAVTLRNPSATRPWQHVLEPLSGYLWLAAELTARGDGINGEAYNFGPAASVNFPVSDLVTRMHGAWGRGRVVIDPATNGSKAEAGLLKLSCDKALSRLGWEATLSYSETVDFTIQWYKHFYAGNVDMRDFSFEQIGQYAQLAAERGRIWVK